MPLEIYIVHPACASAVKIAYRSYVNKEKEAAREPLGMVSWAQENCPHVLVDITDEVMDRVMARFSGTPPQVAMRGDNDNATTA